MISVLREAHSSVFCEALTDKTVARKAMPGKPAETVATSEMPSATTTKMATAATEMAAASSKAATSSTMATAASTMCERCDGRERENAGQDQADK
jgi:hypothetical protein